MHIKKTLSISKIFFFNMLFITTLSSFVIALMWAHHERDDFNKQKVQLKSEYIDTQKLLVKNGVENTMNYILYKKSLTRERLKQTVKQRVYEAYSIAESIYKNNSGRLPDDEIIRLIKQALRPIRFFDNRNYYFIDDLKGNSILFPPKPAYEGKNLMGLTNKEGVRPLPEIIKLLEVKKEGFFVYRWVKYNESRVPTNIEFPKITYFKLFKPYNWFIAVGEYLDYVENDITQEILERVSQIRLENGEYVNIHTHDGVKLVSNGQVLEMPVNELKISDSTGYKYILGQKKIALIDNKGGFVFYNRTDKNKNAHGSMVSFAMSLSEWKWIISVASHIDEVDQVIAQKESLLKKDVKVNLLKIVSVMTGLMILTLAIARYISFKATASFTTFSHFFKRASTEAITIDQNDLHFSEFSELARLANQMIENRHKAESMLQKSEEKYRHLFENLYDVYYRTDVKGIITLVSPSIEKLSGYTTEEIIGKSVETFYLHPQDREELMSQLIRDGYVDNFEVQLKRQDNSIGWVSANTKLLKNETGNYFGVEGILRDVTDQKQMESDIQALVKSTIGMSGPNFFAIIVKKVCEWLNCDAAIIGELIGPSTIQALAMELDGKQTDNYSYELIGSPCEIVVKKGLSVYPEGVSDLFPLDKDLVEMKAVGYIGAPIVDHNNKPIGVLCAISRSKMNLPKRAKEVLTIIAARASAEIERKRMEKKQKKLETYFQQAQKIESIGTLAGGIAHDFNNLLYPLVGFSEMLKEDLPSDSPSQEHIDEILSAAMRAKDLVNQILTFSRQGDQDMKPIKLQPIIKEVMKLIRSTIPTTINIQQDLDHDCGVVVADSTQIHQIVMNITTNAYHAMEETGGLLKVQLKQVRLEQDQITLPNLLPGEYACLTISDTGIGLEKSVNEKIFDPYFTTKDTGRGTGLGLSVVQGIVKKCNGTIHVYSEPGEGTEFQVYLPIMVQKVSSKQAEQIETIQGGTEKILIVDDEEVLLKMEQAMLERLGYQVTACIGSANALDVFKASPDEFDLVLTDMTMPDMTGVQLTGEIRAIRPDIKVILCTGFSYHINDEKSKALGLQGFIMKPVVKHELASVIRNVIDNSKVG